MKISKITKTINIDMETLLELEKVLRNAILSRSPLINDHKSTLNTFLTESCNNQKVK